MHTHIYIYCSLKTDFVCFSSVNALCVSVFLICYLLCCAPVLGFNWFNINFKSYTLVFEVFSV